MTIFQSVKVKDINAFKSGAVGSPLVRVPQEPVASNTIAR